MTVIAKKEEYKLQCKRPLSLKDTLSISQPYDELGKDRDSALNKKRGKRKFISEWNVAELPTLPIFYINQRTSVKITNTKPHIIADRITEYANSMSAGLNYDDLKGGAIISIDRTEISVQLLRINDSTPNAIIVEVMRKNGSSIIFHRAARAILSAAKGDSVTTPRPTSNLQPTTRPDTTKLLKRKQLQMKEDDNTAAEAAIEKVEDLLKKDRFDANLLGIESLLHLTTCGSSSKDMALFTADVILNARSDIVKDTVFSLIKGGRNEEEDEPKNIVESGFNRGMRICALSLLSNALEIISTSDLESKSTDDEWVGDDGLLSSLLCIVKDSKSNVQEAYHAAQCLRTLLNGSASLRSWTMERGVRQIVEQRLSEGGNCCSHTKLGCVLDDILQCVGTDDDCKQLNYKEI